MDKVIVEIYLPAAEQSFDVQIPLSMKVYEIITLASKSIETISEGCFALSDQTTLCDRETGAILNMNITADELGFKNGTKLMLI